MPNRRTTGRGHTGKFERTGDTAERDAEALRLRADNKTYQQIADALGYTNRSAARKAVERALVATVREPAEEVRELQLVQLDRLAREALAVLEREHVLVSHGRTIYADDGSAMLDDGPILSAIDRLLKIQERKAKLLGLDSPTRVEVMSLDAIDGEIRRLTQELGRGAAKETGAASGAPPAGG